MTARWGLYRAQVVNNQDPTGACRLQLRCPQVWGDHVRWALACVPAAGGGVPAAGVTVWIQFEGGLDDQPVWMGVLPSAQA